ncbi:MAG: hypothetical protein J0I29_09775 [Rhizobiales bacterium]|nr:hypothetical protein [Hyphomicrobiales bacterium]
MHLVRSLTFSGWARVCAAAFSAAVLGPAMLGPSAYASDTLEERKLPMKFTWYAAPSGACDRDCSAWIGAVGIITSDTPAKFDDFVKGRDLTGATMVLDSSGGSVLDSIAMGRRWRELRLHTAVGMVIERTPVGGGVDRDILPHAYCESMCVFLLLSGQTRTIPEGAHVRVHQIWMGDRAEDAKAATYSAQDLMIVERDIGRLAKYTFEMGGSGDLLSLALSVPPWEALHELTAAELRATNLITDSAVADASAPKLPVANGKPVQDRYVNAEDGSAKSAPLKSTRTAAVEPPTGGAAPVAPDRK